MNFRPNLKKKDDKKDDMNGSTYEPITKYMSTELVTFTPETEIIEVIDKMLEHRFSGAPVLNNDKELVGLISEKDCLKILIDSAYHNLPIRKHVVDDYMTPDPITVSVESDILDVANLFLQTGVKRFPVVDDKGKLVGQVSRRDILTAVKAAHITTWQKAFA
jgi:CBS domain-containing protein